MDVDFLSEFAIFWINRRDLEYFLNTLTCKYLSFGTLIIFIFSHFSVMSPRDQRSERSVGVGGEKYPRDGEKVLEAKTSHLLEKDGKYCCKWLLY